MQPPDANTANERFAAKAGKYIFGLFSQLIQLIELQ
jgi:hypothetical protein